MNPNAVALYHKLVKLTVVIFIFCSAITVHAAQKGLGTFTIKDKSGNELGHYKNSIALLIAIGDYTNGWPDLESVSAEMSKVETSLIGKGYTVVRVDNPDSRELKDAYEKFINDYGFEKDNQLLFYYSGHGHTMDDNQKGYLVPVDAPHPDVDPIAFKKKALDMNQLLSWSRQMDAKHGLFLFDSCFSGTIFKQKSLPVKIPPTIDKWTSQPVRQFITAGSAGEAVPANSTFTPAFIDAIEGKADLNKDGYIIGTELGMFLQSEVPKHVNQTPQYGKISDYKLSRGDFVFFTPLKNENGLDNTEVVSQLNLSLTSEKGNSIQSVSKNITKKKEDKSTPWYKNPWFWVGTVAVSAFAATQLNKDESNGEGTVIFK